MKKNLISLTLTAFLMVGANAPSYAVVDKTNTMLPESSAPVTLQQDDEARLITDLLSLSFSKLLSGDASSVIAMLNIPTDVLKKGLNDSLTQELTAKYHTDHIKNIAFSNVRLSKNGESALVDYVITYNDTKEPNDAFTLQLDKVNQKWRIDCPFHSCFTDSEMIRFSPQTISSAFIYSITDNNEKIFLETLIPNTDLNLSDKEKADVLKQNRSLLKELNQAFLTLGELDQLILQNIAYDGSKTHALTEFDLVFKNDNTQSTQIPAKLINGKWFIDWDADLGASE